MEHTDIDPTTHLLQYHTELLRMAESVRGMYSRYLPLFIIACAETAALLVSCAIKLGGNPAMNLHSLGDWIKDQPLLYINLALMPPLFIVGYVVLLAMLMKREQYYDQRAGSVRHEIETALQNRSNLVLRGEPVTASLLERVVHRQSLPRQPMVASTPMHDRRIQEPRVLDPRIGITPPPQPPRDLS